MLRIEGRNIIQIINKVIGIKFLINILSGILISMLKSLVRFPIGNLPFQSLLLSSTHPLWCRHLFGQKFLVHASYRSPIPHCRCSFRQTLGTCPFLVSCCSSTYLRTLTHQYTQICLDLQGFHSRINLCIILHLRRTFFQTHGTSHSRSFPRKHFRP